MTDITSIPLNKLVALEDNVRRTAGADTALHELAASIAAHRLLQSLVVQSQYFLSGSRQPYGMVRGDDNSHGKALRAHREQSSPRCH
jgi:hypothetical protein